MTLIAIILLAYLFVAPDKGTLALTRGATGAARAALGLQPRSHKSSTSRSRSGNSRKSSGSRSLLAGWREGVASARKAREDGQDLWSRSSRAGGRVAGGTRNLVGGIRTTVRDRRDRRNQTNVPDPDASPIDIPTADPVPGVDDDVHTGLNQHMDDGSGQPTWPGRFKKAADLSGQQDGELLFSSKTDDLGAAIGESASPSAIDDVPEVAPPADSRFYVWTSPESGQFFVFDRMNLDEPMPAVDEKEADFLASFYNGRHGLAMQNGLAPFAVTVPLKGFGDSHPINPQTPMAATAVGNTNPSTTTRKDASTMAIAGTELGNLDEVDGEAKAALNAIEALTEALNEIKGWGGNLPDRWSGTSWSTDRLDAAVVGVAEQAAELKIPEGLMEQLTEIGAAVAEARSVGEVAAETGARGDLSGFRSN